MIIGTIYNQLITTLQGNATLSGYVRHVFKGVRYNLETDSMPLLMVEPALNGEGDLKSNNYAHLYFNVDILGYVFCPSDDIPTIVGEKGYKGILDLDTDVRACLASSNTLGDSVIDIKMLPTEYSYKEFPIRGIKLPIKIMYSQLNSA